VDSVSQLQVFVKVVEAGGFTAAARELNLPKSTVSRHVARLEDRLGVRLLERTTRAIRTTEVGQAYYERCARIVGDIAQVVPKGTLRLSGPLTFGQLYLGELIAAFMAAHPEVDCEVDLSDRKVDLIEEGYDVAVRIGALADSSMIARRLGSSELVVVASPDYLREHGTPRVPSDLRDHECMRYEYSATSSWSFGDESVAVRGRLMANNGDVLRAAAAAGLGIVQAPRFIVGPDLRSGRLVRVLASAPSSVSGIWAIYPHHRHLSAKVRAFVDFAADYLASAMAPDTPD
jgi:DNA-binding transcriptional LysR family regulator